MASAPEDYIAKLSRQLKHFLGAPIRSIEIRDETICTLVELAIEDYGAYIQEWLIENQWLSLYGQRITTLDMAFALSVRSQDYVTQYSYAYSKQVGLQARGPWELKKDYINIEAGRQVYQIPAGREINQVLWITPSTATPAMFANMAGSVDWGFGGGMAQTGIGGAAGGMGGAGYYLTPAFDTLLLAADMNLKNRLLRSELTYKITAGPDGTRLLHLLSVPNGQFHFGIGTSVAGTPLTGCQVWYHYYDTTGKGSGATADCRAANPDVITLPNEVPLTEMEFTSFNEPTKILIRQLFMAYAKMSIGRTRGKFGGIVGLPEGERTMDWESLLAEGDSDRKLILERLDARLLRLTTTSQLERAANEAEFVNRALKYNPMGIYIK
jgi:hypothetical protein